jgi:hypothetical protein
MAPSWIAASVSKLKEFFSETVQVAHGAAVRISLA